MTRQQIAADIPHDLREADETLTLYGRWAMDRWTPHSCGSIERDYRPKAGDFGEQRAAIEFDSRREAREVLMLPGDAVRASRALIAVPERERQVLQMLYVRRSKPGGGYWPVELLFRRARIPPTLSQVRHLTGLRIFANLWRRLG